MNLDLRYIIAFALLGSAFTLAGACSTSEDDTSGDSDADTDTDTDSDTDADADTDTDTDSDADSDSTISGNLEYQMVVNGATVCDASIALTGTGYTGDCDDCEWMFDMDSTVTRDDGTSDCALFAPLSTVPDDLYYKIYLGYWKELTVDSYYSPTYTDALATDIGFIGVYGDEYPGPYTYYAIYYAYSGMVLSSNETEPTLTIDGNDLSWTFDFDGFYSDPFAYYCAPFAGDAKKALPGDVYGTGDVTCTGAADIWSFYVAYGADVTVTVDTLAEKTAFDGFFYVNDPDGCTVAYSDESFTCTYPPPTLYLCPSAEFTAVTAGTYSAMVLAYGGCASDVAAYDLRLGGVTDLTQTQDNGHPYSYSISATATLAP